MATAKRSRVTCGFSSRIFDVDSAPPLTSPVADTANQPNNPNKSMRACPVILTISPPPELPLPVNAQPPVAGFLDKCHFCGKRIPPLSEIFMYRDFCAFCSKECRDNQIKYNGLPEELSILHKSPAP